jgi:hypothetical protein
MTEPQVITKNYKPEQTDSLSHCPNATPMLPATTIIRIWRALPCLARRAEQDYPDARHARHDYPDARYHQLLSSPPRLCRGQKKPAPNAEAPEAGHGPKAAGVNAN